MLLSTCDTNAQAKCPTCGKVVQCQSTRGNLAFAPRYMEFIHELCGTKWRRYIDEARTETIDTNKEK